MSVDPTVLAREAELLGQALRDRAPVSPPRERIPGLTIHDAYEIQRGTIAARERTGSRRVGRKIGLTSAAMQQMLGVAEPDFGVLLDDMVVAAADGIDASTLIAPRAEPEIGFWLAQPLHGEVTIEQVLAATRSVCAAIEIIDSRVVDWKIAIEDTIADNASSALVVLGPEHPAGSVDLAGETVELRVGAAAAESGRGDAVLGHPAAAVVWLTKTLAQHGEQLQANDLVLPGAMTRALPFATGDSVEAAFGTLGRIHVRIR
jgi:2-keto-4-pentenoate hydratase